MVGMKWRSGCIFLCAFAFLISTPVAHAQLRGGSWAPDDKCALGVSDSTNPEALKPGAECARDYTSCKGVSSKPPADAQAGGTKQEAYITYTCKNAKCTPTYGCDNIELKEPEELPGGTKPIPLDPNTKPEPIDPAPTPTTPINPTPTPTTPITKPDITIPGSGTGGSGTGGGTGNVPGAPGENALPAVDVVQNPTPTPRPGVTFNTDGSPFTLGPGVRPSTDATFGQSPGNVFGDPWGSGSNTTFTGSFGGTGWSGNAAAGINLFSNFVSAIGSLFGGFGGGGGAAVVDTTPTPAANPAPTPSLAQPPVTTRPPIQIADNAAEERLKALDEKLKKLNEARGTDINVPTQSPLDLPLERNILTGFPIVPLQPADRIGLPTVGSGEPLIGNVPRGTLPPAVVRDAENPSGITIPIPEPAPQSPPTIVTTIIPATTAEAFVRVEEARDALESRSTFDRFLDWVGIGSAEGVAYRRAQQDLKAASMRESLEKMAVDVRAIPDVIQVAEGGPVATDAAPIEIDALEKTLTPQQRAQFEREYEGLVREFDAAASDEERTEIMNRKLDEIRAIDPAIEKALEGTTFEIQLEEPTVTYRSGSMIPEAVRPSTMLEGLSRIGERVRDATQAAAERVGALFGIGANIPPDTRIPTVIDQVSDDAPSASIPPTVSERPLPSAAEPPAAESPVAERPAPTPQPAQPAPASQQPQAASRPNSFLQGSISLLSALLGTVLNFFNGDDQSSSAPTQPSQPAQPNAAASITANPSYVDDGDTAELSWTSVGTLSCVVVDSALNIIMRGGKEGDLVSPALSVSTRFGVICDIEEGKDKFVNETLVRVNDDTSEPERLFAQSGRVSQAASVSGNGTGGADVGGSGGSSASPQPIDVRTCDPEQSMDTFIRCLCEAEPNPNGCSLVPRQ